MPDDDALAPNRRFALKYRPKCRDVTRRFSPLPLYRDVDHLQRAASPRGQLHLRARVPPMCGDVDRRDVPVLLRRHDDHHADPRVHVHALVSPAARMVMDAGPRSMRDAAEEPLGPDAPWCLGLRWPPPSPSERRSAGHVHRRW